jgi:DNA-binding NarL/FixJ family response regulator
MSTRILLADDHQIVREGLKALIDRHPGIEVVGEADNGRQVIEMARSAKPDIVVMDIAMPDLNGIEATQRIIAECPGMKIIGLSMYSDKRYVAEMLKAGALGYILKDCAFHELINAVKAVAADRIYLSPGLTEDVIKDYVQLYPRNEFSLFSVLTQRQRQVLQHMAEGKNTKEIAYLLEISAKTVETYRKQIMEKLNLYSIAELTKYAIREGLTTIQF